MLTTTTTDSKYTPSMSNPVQSHVTATTETNLLLEDEIAKVEDNELDKKVHQFLDVAEFRSKTDPSSDQLMQQLEKSLKFCNRHYEVGLLWKEDHKPLKPN
jgi:hypothetical protein